MISYKFGEEKYLEELKNYIDKTYSQHYSGGDPNAPQTFEAISKIPEKGYWFSIGSIQKYADRISLKDDERKELLKIAHYAILALYNLDKRGVK